MSNIYVLIIFVLQTQLNYSQIILRQDPIQQIKQLHERISSSISLINSHYTLLTKNLQETIQNIINRSTISESISKLQTNVNRFGQSQCAKYSESAVTSLSASSKEDVSVCAEAAISALTNNITLEAERLITKFVSLQGDITNRVASCFRGNLANQVALALCLVSQINPVQGDVATLMQEIEKTFALSESVAQEIVFSLSNCILNVQNEIDKIASNIVGDFRKCIIV